MAGNRQTNVRLRDEYRDRLYSLAAGEGVSVGAAIELLLDNVPMKPVTRTGFVLQKNNGCDAKALAGHNVATVRA